MDALINDGLTGNSVLESSKNAQKHYEDVYSTFDSALLSQRMALTVGVEVEISDKKNDDSRTTVASGFTPSNITSISNAAQARVAPDLSGLRTGQDLHNRLQTVSAGLKDLRSNLDEITQQIGPGVNYADNTQVQDAIAQIKNTLEITTYAGKPLFSSLQSSSSDSAIEISNISELTEKRYAAIQSTILAKAEQVVQGEDGIALTQGTETFMLAQSGRKTVFAFAEATPLEEINQRIADTTTSPKIYPLIHFEQNAAAQSRVVTGAGKGPVDFAGSIEITALDGELFSTPLETYSTERNGTYHQRDGRIVEGDKSVMAMSEHLGDNRTVGTINLADDHVVDGQDVDNMRRSNHALTRSEAFNERLSRDRREGDGFAVTPLDTGASSGSLTAGSELRDSARSTNYTANFTATSPEAADDVMLLPKEEESTPYVTLQQQEAGITGTDSLNQVASRMSDVADQEQPETSTLGDSGMFASATEDNGDTDAERNFEGTANKTVLTDQKAQDMPYVSAGSAGRAEAEEGIDSAVVAETQPRGSGQVTSASAAIEGDTVSSELDRNTLGVLQGEGVAVSADQESRSGNPGLTVQGQEQNAANAQSSAGSTSVGAESTISAASGPGAGAVVESESNETEESAESTAENMLTRKGRYIGTNPIHELESIRGTVADTLLFTLRGDLGEMDYAVAAGVAVDTLSLAINTTTSYTGVTASTANGNLSLAGVSSLLDSTRVVVAADASGFEAGDGSADGGGENLAQANSGNMRQRQAVLTTADSDALGINSFTDQVDVSGLGRTEAVSGSVYDVYSFAEKQTPPELSDNPQLARRVLNTAYRYIGAVESNIEALKSNTMRAAYEALERVGAKILGGGESQISSAEESDRILNNIAVEMNNSISLNGGRALESSPSASLNLLNNIENTAGKFTNRGISSVENTLLAKRLSNYQAATDYALEVYDEEEELELEQSAEETEANSGGYSDVQSTVERFAENITEARYGLEMMREYYARAVAKNEADAEAAQYAEERYFANIENAKATIREYGREYEAALSYTESIEEAASSRMSAERREQLGAAASSTVAGLEAAAELAVTRVPEPEGVGGNAAIDSVQPGSGIERVLEAARTAQESVASERLRQEAVQGKGMVAAEVMDSFTSQQAVAVTGAGQGSSVVAPAFEDGKYRGVVALFEDKIGTAVVRGQEYTLKSLEGGLAEMTESEPEVVASILEQAAQDMVVIDQDIADLRSQELEQEGEELLAAFESYGSELSANNPAVVAHAAEVRR